MNKSDIIQEIIRTTEENNGVPLGKQKFQQETGIKEYDWFGKYWRNWSEALIEAGFEPNKMVTAYDHNWLIEQIIFLIREIKKFPTIADYRMKRFNTKKFPSHSVIQSFGSKHEIARKILDFCKDSPKYQDISEICNEVCKTPEKRDGNDAKESEVKFGYVYLMKSGRYYKIGKSDFVEKRKYDIGIKLPEELKTLHKIKTDDPIGIENYWHKRFDKKRKGGEWFDLSKSDVSAFKRRKFM